MSRFLTIWPLAVMWVLIPAIFFGVWGQDPTGEYPMEFQPDLAADLVVLIDGSNSTFTTDSTGRRIWAPGIYEFIMHIMNFFRLGGGSMRVGVIIFSDTVTDIVPFMVSSGYLDQYIYEPTSTAGDRRTDLGLSEMQQLFNTGRPGYLRRALLVTDGVSASTEGTSKEAWSVKKNGIDMVALGIGDSSDMIRELEIIAPRAVYQTPSTDTLATSSIFYELLLRLGAQPLHGGWSEWSDWGNCSAACGIANQSRTRLCDQPPALYGGTVCAGNYTDIKNCVQDPCPVDGKWSSWADWGECSATCGAGNRKRTRNCNNPIPSNNGLDCEGFGENTVSCVSEPCPVLGRWLQWSDWGECSVSCGDEGYEKRTRSCEMLESVHNGEDCVGLYTEQRSCSEPLEECVVVDGGWSEWKSSSQCSVTCGDNGFITRIRKCSNPRPSNGGIYCAGPSRNTRPCTDPMPDPCPEVNANLGEWSEWESCSGSCGLGIQHRYRNCINSDANDCEGRVEETRMCEMNTTCPPWTDWTPCSVTCGNGTQARIRECLNSTETETCQGLPREMKPCEIITPCPSDENCISVRASQIDVRFYEEFVDGRWLNRNCERGHIFSDTSCTCVEPAFAQGDITMLDTHDPVAIAGFLADAGFVEFDANGNPIFPRDANGNPIVPTDADGNPLLSTDADGNPILPIDAEGNIIIPDDIDLGELLSRINGNSNNNPSDTETETETETGTTDDATDSDETVTEEFEEVPICWSTWSMWGGCSAMCGGGSKKRTRYCRGPEPDGCEGQPEETGACNEMDCSYAWDDWSEWTDCSAVVCDAMGTRQRERTCLSSDVDDCPGTAVTNEECQRTCIVDGAWSEWMNLGDCDCQTGMQIMQRQCDNPQPQHGGDDCPGMSEMSQQCDGATDCPIDGNWSIFSNWSPCSVTCEGVGEQKRIRRCIDPSPSNGGVDCVGPYLESQECDMSAIPCSIDVWTPWSIWSECNDKCHQIRIRTCLNTVPINQCPSSSREEVEKLDCCEVVDGVWSEFSPYSSCSATCGVGLQMFRRKCDSPPPQNGGAPCTGSDTSESECDTGVTCTDSGGPVAACFIDKPTVNVVNGDVTIIVQFESLSTPQTRWLREGELLRQGTKYNIILEQLSETKYQNELQIQNPDEEDKSSYQFVVTNTDGQCSVFMNLDFSGSNSELNEVDPPQFTQDPLFEYNPGDDFITLTIFYQSVLPATVTWLKNGQSISFDEGRHLYEESSNKNQYTAILKILNPSSADSGHYSFSVTNEVGSTSAAIEISDIPNISGNISPRAPEQPIVSLEKQRIIVTVLINADPAPEFEWFKGDDDPVVQDSNHLVSIETDANTANRYIGKFEILNHVYSDNGDYKVVATNSLGKVGVTFNIGYTGQPGNGDTAPRFTQQPSVQSRSMLVTLFVYLEGTPDIYMSWSKNEMAVTSYGRHLISMTEDTNVENGFISTLQIKSPSAAADSGFYTVEAYNFIGKTRIQFLLVIDQDGDVRLMPISSPSIIGRPSLRIKEALVTMSVTFESNYPLKPEWTKGGDLMVNDNRHESIVEPVPGFDNRYKATLQIKELTAFDSGIYILNLQNDFGDTSAYIDVNLQDYAPQFIDDLNAAGSNDEFTLSIPVISASLLEVDWFREETSVEEFGRFSSSISPDSSEVNQYLAALVIKNLESDDGTIYKVVAQNGFGDSVAYIVLSSGYEGWTLRMVEVPSIQSSTDNLESGDIVLTVITESAVIPDFHWYRDGTEITNDDNYIISNYVPQGSSITYTSTLRILSAHEADEGEYLLRATNFLGTTTAVITVDFEEVQLNKIQPPTLTSKPRIDEKEGSVMISLTFTADPNRLTDISWSKKGIRISQIHDDRYILETKPSTAILNAFTTSLTIQNPRDSDNGVYKVVIKNDAAAENVEIDLVLKMLPVGEAPLFLHRPTVRDTGESLYIEVDFESNSASKPSIQWFKGNTDITTNTAYTTIMRPILEFTNRYRATLMLSNPTMADAGYYKVVIKNDVASRTAFFTVDVEEDKDSESGRIKMLQPQLSLMESLLEIAVIFTIDPDVQEVSWFVNNNELTNEGRVQIELEELPIDVDLPIPIEGKQFRSTLSIVYPTNDDSGMYTVTISNGYITSSESITVYIGTGTLSDWSECSVNCGYGGTRERIRQCEGQDCDGNDRDVEFCTGDQLCDSDVLICRMNHDFGSCSNSRVMWFYDFHTGECDRFTYSGCGGNQNKFDSRQDCETECNSERVCQKYLPSSTSCDGNIPRYRFNTDTKTCEHFTWGGCGGSTNNFSTKQACWDKCGPTSEGLGDEEDDDDEEEIAPYG